MTTIDLPIIVLVVGLLVLGIAALGWGVDSRPSLTDDHRR
jgi:hypothetical protein